MTLWLHHSLPRPRIGLWVICRGKVWLTSPQSLPLLKSPSTTVSSQEEAALSR